MACPQCASEDGPRPIGFTWWGGLLGPKLLSHVECVHCGTRFNGKTGRSNNTAITIYMVIVGLLGVGLVFAFTSHH